MSREDLPFEIMYKTVGRTSVSDLILALQATETVLNDAIGLIPSFIDGLEIQDASISVRIIRQESPLRELFLVSMFLVYQDELEAVVPPLVKNSLRLSISEKYDTLITVAFLTVVFYGAGMAVDVVKKTSADSLPRQKFEELINVLAVEVGKPADEIRKIIESKFLKPSAAKRLIRSAKDVFAPSKKDQNAPVVFDRDLISSDLVREIPYAGDADKERDFDRYRPYTGVDLEIHAQDRDRASTGWAEIADGVSKRRLKLKVLDPVSPADLWGQDRVNADIVVVSKLTSEGYIPSEIHLSRINRKFGLEH